MFRWDEKKMCPISKFHMSQETFGGFCVVCNYFIYSQNLRNLFSDIFFFPCGNNNLYFDIFFFPCGNNILYLNKVVLLVGTLNLTDKIAIFCMTFILVHIRTNENESLVSFIMNSILCLWFPDSNFVISLNMVP